MAKKSDNLYTLILPGYIQGKKTPLVVDTAAQVTLISQKYYDTLNNKPNLTEEVRLRGVGNEMSMKAFKAKDVQIGLNGKNYTWDIFVAPIHDDFILGIDFMFRFGAKIDLKNGLFSIGKDVQYMHIIRNGDKPFEVSRVWVPRKIVIPPNTVQLVNVKTSLDSNSNFAVSPTNKNKGLMLPNLLVKGKRDVIVQLMNITDQYISLKKDHVLGLAIEADIIVQLPEEESVGESNSSKSDEAQTDEVPRGADPYFSFPSLSEEEDSKVYDDNEDLSSDLITCSDNNKEGEKGMGTPPLIDFFSPKIRGALPHWKSLNRLKFLSAQRAIHLNYLNICRIYSSALVKV